MEQYLEDMADYFIEKNSGAKIDKILSQIKRAPRAFKKYLGKAPGRIKDFAKDPKTKENAKIVGKKALKWTGAATAIGAGTAAGAVSAKKLNK